MLLFELGPFLGIEGGHQLGLEEDFGFSRLGGMNTPRLGDFGLLFLGNGAFFDTGLGVTAPQTFHRKLVRALGRLIRHTASYCGPE